MEQETFDTYEWKIENFSSWNENVHGKVIRSPPFFFTHFEKAELLLRGVSGRNGHMEVLLCGCAKDFTGTLSLIGSGGCLICKQQMKRKGEKVLRLSPGCKFEEVVDEIRKAKQEDQLTLRFSIQDGKYYEQRMCTCIDVLKISLKIETKLITSIKSDDSRGISYIPYASKKDYEGMFVKAVRKNEGIQLILEQKKKKARAVLVESCTQLLSFDDALVRSEENKQVFTEEEAWAFSDSLKINELEEKCNTIFLQFKITNGHFINSYNHLLYHKDVSIVPNSETRLTEQKPSPINPVSSNQSEDSWNVLKDDLMCLYQDQDFSDFQLNCGNVSFPVHRVILSARSPVFRTMLSSDMIEAASGKADIVDLEPSTLGLFLTYLYTGAVDELQGESAVKLYYAADKYQVSALKRECEGVLRSDVSISNVCDILRLADKHRNEELIAISHYFILRNYNDVLRSKDWERFMERDPLLALKTVTQFGAKDCVRKHDPY